MQIFFWKFYLPSFNQSWNYYQLLKYRNLFKNFAITHIISINFYSKSIDRFLTKNPVFSSKTQSQGYASEFIDHCNVCCISGDGGEGYLSFAREYKVPFGGADGGNGGNGGHIIFMADSKTTDLSKISQTIKAKQGERGAGRCCHGKDSKHVYVPVPLNTLIKKPCFIHRSLEKGIIHELNTHGDIFIAARGGAGGHGNNFFLSNNIRKPCAAELGGKGETISYELEMRIIASAGLVGFPNAGKSSFLRSISRAKPKVANYPFTTLKAHIGIVLYEDFEQISVADIPGIIEGAHKNDGLGFNFLKHICRCESIFYFLDYTLGEWRHQYKTLQRELFLYNSELNKKATAIIINKSDLIKDQKIKNNIKELFPNDHVFFVSALNKVGLEPVLKFLRKIYDCN